MFLVRISELRRGSALPNLREGRPADGAVSVGQHDGQPMPGADHVGEMRKIHPDERVSRRNLLDHDRDFDALATRVFDKRGSRSVSMPHAEAGSSGFRCVPPVVARREAAF